MAHRFVNLQAELGAFQDDVEHAFGAMVGAMQRHGFFADAAGIFHQLQFFDQLITFVLPLPAERTGIRAFLNLVAGKGVGSITGAGSVLRLMDVGAL